MSPEFGALWALWVLAFGVIEGIAIKNRKHGDTLSEWLRFIFRTRSRKGRFAWFAVIGFGVAWFITHIAVKGSA